MEIQSESIGRKLINRAMEKIQIFDRSLHLISGNGKWCEESNDEEDAHFGGNTGLGGFGASEFEWQSLFSYPDVSEDRFKKGRENKSHEKMCFLALFSGEVELLTFPTEFSMWTDLICC